MRAENTLSKWTRKLNSPSSILLNCFTAIINVISIAIVATVVAIFIFVKNHHQFC